jgi:hypothetical protein
MRNTVLLAALAGAAACTGPETVDDGVENANFDKQIDGLNDLDEPDTVESFDARMCVAGNGTIYVVWRDARVGPSDVWFNRSDDGGQTFLSSPILVKQGPGNASGVQLACAGERVYVVWEDDRDGETGYQNIYVNFSTNSGDDWLAADVALDNDPDGLAISLGPQIRLSGNKVHIVWYDQLEGAPDVYMSTSINGGRKFEEPIRVSGDREDESGAGEYWSGNPQMEVDSAGRIYVVWEDTRNGRQDIFASVSSTEGRSFGPQKRIDTGDTRGTAYSFSPKLGVSEGHAYVVWHDSRAGVGRDIFMNYSSDGGDNWFDAAVRAEGDAAGFSESINPDILVDGDTAHIVWQDQRDLGYDIYYRKAVAGVLDETIEELDVRLDTDGPGVGNSDRPSIALNGEDMVVAWRDYRADGADQGYNDLYYNHTLKEDVIEGWADEDLRLDSIADGTSFTEDLNLEIHNGEIYAAWIDGRNGTRNVFFSRTIIGEAVESLLDYVTDPNDAQGQQ